MQMTARTKNPKKKNKQAELVPKLSKKELLRLKSAYKKGQLHFDSKDVARAMLMDEDVKRGLTK